MRKELVPIVSTPETLPSTWRSYYLATRWASADNDFATMVPQYSLPHSKLENGYPVLDRFSDGGIITFPQLFSHCWRRSLRLFHNQCGGLGGALKLRHKVAVMAQDILSENRLFVVFRMFLLLTHSLLILSTPQQMGRLWDHGTRPSNVREAS